MKDKFIIAKPPIKKSTTINLPKSFNPIEHDYAPWWELDTTGMDWDEVVERVGKGIEKAKGVMRLERLQHSGVKMQSGNSKC